MVHITKTITGLLTIVMSSLSSCVSTNNIDTTSRAEGFTIEVTKNNHVPRNYRKMLIESSGTSSTRLFFDNLYEALSTGLLKVNISTEKEFNANDFAHTFYPIDKFRQSQAYDAVLKISPGYADHLNEKNVMMATQANQFEHIFKFTIFDKQGRNNPVWELSLNINIDFTQAGPYQKLAEKILDNMKMDKLLQ